MSIGTEQVFVRSQSKSQSSTAEQKMNVELAAGSQRNLDDIENFSNVCRTCATITEFVMPIFEGEGLQNNLAEKIQKHLPIQVSCSDALPLVVCYQCASTLLAWHELVQCCVQADAALRTRLARAQPPVPPPAQHNATSDSPNVVSNIQDTKTATEENNDSEKEQQNKSETLETTLKRVIMEYFDKLNEEDIAFQYVCQKCDGQPALTAIDTLASHLIASHQTEITNGKGVKSFIKNYVTFEEALTTEDIEEGNEDNITERKPKLPHFFCPVCDCVFSSTTRLIFHLNTHMTLCLEDGVKCCGALYRDKKNYVQHLQSHSTRNLNSDTVCRSCGFDAESSEELHCHVLCEHVESKADSSGVKIKQSNKNQKFIPAVCPECDRTFSNKYNMMVHMKSHNEKVAKSYPCSKCRKSFTYRGNLVSHVKVAHEGVMEYVCNYCGEAFPRKNARDVHHRIHSGAKPYRCEYCDKCFRAKNTLDRHIETHTMVKNYECDICQRRFSRSSHLKYKPYRYWESYRSINKTDALAIEGNDAASDTSFDDDQPLSNIANKKSSTLYQNFYTALLNFRNHFVNEHADESDMSDSSISDASVEKNGEVNVDSFDDLSQFNMRKDRMDEQTRSELNQAQTKINGKLYYTCKVCGKNLSASHTYLLHKRIHTGERPCVCHVCGKQFRLPNGLQRHLLETHERVRRHPCRYCPKTFTNRQNLKLHTRIHTGERPFVCTQCGKRFTQSGSLYVHLKTHTGDFPFPCGECGAKFRVRSALARHTLKHTGERPHVCSHCGKAFRQRHELTAHGLSHSDTKPYCCSMCGASFRQRRALKHHHKRTHETEAPTVTHQVLYAHIGQY